MFSLECNHDSVTITSTANGTATQLWKGGCQRDGDFIVTTAANIDTVTIAFSSDDSVSYEGMALHYESVDAIDAEETVTVPCPVTASGLCSLNGACLRGSCLCFSGFVGESCSNAVICPTDVTTCLPSTCDPICIQPPSDVIAVSVNGDDTQGTGQLMDTSQSGTDSKAVRSLRRALELAQSSQTIILYPGIYTGPDNCGVTVSTPNVVIRGLRGSSVTTMDCQGLRRGLTFSGATAQLIGLVLQNTATTSSGSGISTMRATVRMEDVRIAKGSSLQNGGGIYADQSTLTLVNSEVANCSAVSNGGAVFLSTSNLILDHSVIKFSTAGQGGGIYAQHTVSVHGDASSQIVKNWASVNGGGICAAGSFSGGQLNILENSALVGAGMAVTTGSSVLTNVDIHANSAVNDGGGIALLNTANLVLKKSPVRMNHAARFGGGILVGSNGTFENNEASTIFSCTAGTLSSFPQDVHVLVMANRRQLCCLMLSVGSFWWRVLCW